MPFLIVILVPLLVCMILAGALHVAWRRMPDADYARHWMAACWLGVFGWAAAAIETGLSGRLVFPGGASVLCWLAAALLSAIGIRRGRRSRSVVLLAIWLGTAIGVALLLDLRIADRTLETATVQILAAGGAMMAALAIGPRRRRYRPRAATHAASLLAAFAAISLAGACAVLLLPERLMIEGSLILVVPVVLLGVMAMVRLNDERAYALQRLARTDALTGIWNRRGFDEAAQHLLVRLRAAQGTQAAVAIADLDGFKAINDHHGHATGDATLVRFAQILASVAEPGDLLARLGGEEFVVLALAADAAALHHRLERVRSLLSVPSIEPNGPPTITASFGVAEFDGEPTSLRDALERADRALYRSKSDGRNRVTLAE